MTFSLDDLRNTRTELIALRQLGVEAGHDLAVGMLDGLLSDLDAAERVFHKLTDRQTLLKKSEDAIYREQAITEELAQYPCLTREQAEARVDHELAEHESWRAERETEENRVKEYVRSLDQPATIRQIKEATGHPNTNTIWRLCRAVAKEGCIEAVPPYHGFATQITPKRRRQNSAILVSQRPDLKSE